MSRDVDIAVEIRVNYLPHDIHILNLVEVSMSARACGQDDNINMLDFLSSEGHERFTLRFYCGVADKVVDIEISILFNTFLDDFF